MTNFIIEHIDNLVTGLVGGVSGWFFTRKQQAAEVKGAEANALEGMQRAYDNLVKDMNEKFSEIKAENAELKVEINKLHKENAELKRMLKKL
jgi:predicted RNase H-like nuclease (RuvC/YqgF family)